MLIWSLGLVMTGASAPINCRLTFNLSEERIAAIRNPASNHPQRASLANGRPGFPTRVNPHRAHLAQPRRGEFPESLQKVSRDACRGC